MTHPDILMTERYGTLDPQEESVKIGECVNCGNSLYDRSPESVQSRDGFFCDMDCCHDYYEISIL